MNKVVVLLIVAAFALLPAQCYAGGGHAGHGGFGGGGGWGHGFHGNGFHGNGFHGHGFASHGHGFSFHGRGFVVVGPGCCWGPWWWGAFPPLYYAPPVAFYPPSYYPPAFYGPPPGYSPPAGYAPTATVSVAPAQPTPNVVQFDTGRYELRGDGVTTPYRWVWIPNPPTAPPQVAPVGARPVASAR